MFLSLGVLLRACSSSVGVVGFDLAVQVRVRNLIRSRSAAVNVRGIVYDGLYRFSSRGCLSLSVCLLNSCGHLAPFPGEIVWKNTVLLSFRLAEVTGNSLAATLKDIRVLFYSLLIWFYCVASKEELAADISLNEE